MKTKKDVMTWLKSRFSQIDEDRTITQKFSVFSYPNYIPESYPLKIQALKHAQELLIIIDKYEKTT